ncbi:MAG: bifunctional nuclease family protein [Bradyrhizobiaceae bacterium]|nr:bifunctional nuclease family protein [Bradyrhizobiaceae bacterium]
MNRIQMDIFGLTDRGMSQGAFALILKEADGPRRMPIIIGIPEAQAIANELEGVRPARPMTHDLLRKVMEALGGHLKEVVIHTLREGTFYASLNFEYSGLEVDARPSDAIAIAVRCGVPIYVTEEILNEAAIDSPDSADGNQDEPDEEHRDADDAEEGEESESYRLIQSADPKPEAPLTERERLEKELSDAIRVEDYERAARIRDELKHL